MRRHLLATLALSVFCALFVAATAIARDDLITTSTTGVDINIPSGENLPPVNDLPESSNLKDDHEAQAIDLEDPDCTGQLDDDESTEPDGGGTAGGDPTGGDLPPAGGEVTGGGSAGPGG